MDIVKRFLRDDERHILSKEYDLPLVIEAKVNKSNGFLMDFLRSSSDVLDDVMHYGAVLLRGFDIKTTAEFEKIILSIPGMVGINHAFMSEKGRVLVDNSQYVLHTNSIVKTGGHYNIGGFHNENYHTPDVPAYIAFFCMAPSALGGETGLVNMTKVYGGLDLSLQEKLERNSFFVKEWPIPIIEKRYQTESATIKKLGKEFGLIVNSDSLAMNKPSVLYDPRFKRKSLFTHMCAEIPNLDRELLKAFKYDYKGLQWWSHRAVWVIPSFHKIYHFVRVLSVLARNPKWIFKLLKKNNKNANSKKRDCLSIGSAFLKNDVENLANLMRLHYSSFLWKPGDILLIDNMQIAHAGMPGKSKKYCTRTIRAMICNPLRMSYAAESPGIQIKEELATETFGEKLHKVNLKM